MKQGAGLLNQRVRFDRRVTANDQEGNYVANWSVAAGPVWARIKPLTGGESVIAERLAGVVRYEITVRSSIAVDQVGPDCRAVDIRSGKAFNIRSVVNPDENNIYLIMTADDGPVDG
jgi:SPP1 family predicted phage head-tail adaptor